ncbi:hypothetical protein GCM10010270_17610 [Streptomyces violaceus]|uniref:hypothetical protein n=1 Tax=Streptomyces violaceus TaxID=1936 RepID=UPI001875BFB6|nr:hypothetical protein [Streptomyces janthinus]GGS48039.1 hypothetical protein GCM10010270_17610 [Streptomyces janthinus]
MTTTHSTAAAGGAQLVGTPGRPADDKQQPECGHWIGAERRYCKEVGDVRRFLPGLRCPAHTPNALKGLPEIPPGPGWPAHRT